MDRRAFTLLELLIAVAVLLAIVSLATPSIYARLAVTRGEEARAMLDAAVIEARADAARRGEPVRLVVRERTDGSFVVEFETLEARDDDTMAPLDDADADVDMIDQPDRAIDARVELPDKCRLLPSSALDDLDSLDALHAWLEEIESPEPVRTLAVVLPDGALLPGASLMLITPRGEAFTMTVQSWGGGAVFERWEPEEMEFQVP